MDFINSIILERDYLLPVIRSHMQSILINNIEISENNFSFLIAEAGVNHNGNLDLAKRLCLAAKESGADAIKFQTWKTEELLTKEVMTATYQKNTANEKSQFELLKKLELSFDDFGEISEYCKKIDIIFLSTPGDIASVEFLEKLDIPIFKIGSDDLDNFPLLKHIAQKGKPMILSTGMSTMNEINESYSFIKKYNDKIVLLHCTSSYPTKIFEVNMNAMASIKNRLETLVGYSDHTTTEWIPSVAVGLGAKVIEKHLTLDKTLPGPDHLSSLEPLTFSRMVQSIRKTEKMLGNTKSDTEKLIRIINEIFDKDLSNEIRTSLGSYEKTPTESEKEIMKVVKKTLVASRDIKAEEEISENNLAVRRAGKISISPRNYFNIINKRCKEDIMKNEVISIEKLY